jgi:sulfite reductase alpha subunit-like flavoprotein
MSYDVEKTLVNIISTHKNVSEETALEYLQQMEEDSRYHKDVY